MCRYLLFLCRWTSSHGRICSYGRYSAGVDRGCWDPAHQVCLFTVPNWWVTLLIRHVCIIELINMQWNKWKFKRVATLLTLLTAVWPLTSGCHLTLNVSSSSCPGPQFAEEPAPAPMPTPSFGDYRQYQWEDPPPISLSTRPFWIPCWSYEEEMEMQIATHQIIETCTWCNGLCQRSEGWNTSLFSFSPEPCTDLPFAILSLVMCICFTYHLLNTEMWWDLLFDICGLCEDETYFSILFI